MSLKRIVTRPSAAASGPRSGRSPETASATLSIEALTSTPATPCASSRIRTQRSTSLRMPSSWPSLERQGERLEGSLAIAGLVAGEQHAADPVRGCRRGTGARPSARGSHRAARKCSSAASCSPIAAVSRPRKRSIGPRQRGGATDDDDLARERLEQAEQPPAALDVAERRRRLGDPGDARRASWRRAGMPANSLGGERLVVDPSLLEAVRVDEEADQRQPPGRDTGEALDHAAGPTAASPRACPRGCGSAPSAACGTAPTAAPARPRRAGSPCARAREPRRSGRGSAPGSRRSSARATGAGARRASRRARRTRRMQRSACSMSPRCR